MALAVVALRSWHSWAARGFGHQNLKTKHVQTCGHMTNLHDMTLQACTTEIYTQMTYVYLHVCSITLEVLRSTRESEDVREERLDTISVELWFGGLSKRKTECSKSKSKSKSKRDRAVAAVYPRELLCLLYHRLLPTQEFIPYVS